MYAQCQAIQETALGAEHSDVAETLHNRAELWKAQVRPPKKRPGKSWKVLRTLHFSKSGRVV